MGHEANSDAALAGEAMAGEPAALAEIYRRHRSAVYRFALLLTASPAAADDITQQVFLEWIAGRARFQPARGSLSAFLCGVARVLALRRGLEPIAEPNDEPATPTDEGPLARLEAAERQALVRQAVLGLPRHYREVVALCDMQELSLAEAGRVLAISPATVGSRRARARSLLLARLANLALHAIKETR